MINGVYEIVCDFQAKDDYVCIVGDIGTVHGSGDYFGNDCKQGSHDECRRELGIEFLQVHKS